MLKIERRGHMEKDILINEIMWEYNVTRKTALRTVNVYESLGKYNELCDLVKNKEKLYLVTRKD